MNGHVAFGPGMNNTSSGPSKGKGDARRHPRFSVDVEATIKRGGGGDFKARTRDLSLTGICLVASSPMAVGSTENISLVLSFGQGAYSEPLSLPARVVWCTRIGSAYQVGAMFEDVSDEQDSYLDMFLQFLDGTLTPRGSGAAPDDEDPEDNRKPSPDELDDPFRR